MRKIVGLVLIALGVATVGLAIALPTAVYRAVATVPQNPDSKQVALGQDVRVLKAREDNMRPYEGDVRVVRYVEQEDPRDHATPDDGQVMWRVNYSARTSEEDDNLLVATIEVFTLDGFTGEAVGDCCGDYRMVDADVKLSVAHEGLSLKFPFGTEQRSYDFWDSNLQKALPIDFVQTEEINGVEVYKFEQTIPDTKLQEVTYPGTVFDNATSESVTADEVYANVRTLWVEPNTGAIIKGQEDLNWRFEGTSEEVTGPRTVGVFTYTDETVEANLAKYADSIDGLKLITSVLPMVLWIVGPLLLLGGAVLYMFARDDDEVDENWGAETTEAFI